MTQKKCELFFKIADIIVRIKSDIFPQKNINNALRYEHFISRSAPGPIDIDLNLEVIPLYREFKQKILFVATNNYSKQKYSELKRKLGSGGASNDRLAKYLGGVFDWRIAQVGQKLLFEGMAASQYQLLLDKSLKKGKVFMINPKNRWGISRAIHGFLQILLIYYLTRNKLGILVHSAGIKDGRNGYLFAGESRSGKSTTARIWNNHSSVNILNDDRVIVRKKDNKFYMYSTPWHGDYLDYFDNGFTDKALLTKLFSIYHTKDNRAKKVDCLEGFSIFFQALFVSFWDKHCLEFASGFLADMFFRLSFYRLGFRNNKNVISYVRRLQ